MTPKIVREVKTRPPLTEEHSGVRTGTCRQFCQELLREFDRCFIL